jgi:hypothetical protein
MFEKSSEPFGINDTIMMEISDAVGAHHQNYGISQSVGFPNQ